MRIPMHLRLHAASAAFLIGLLFLVAACGKSGPTAPKISNGEYQDVLDAGGDFAPVDTYEHETVKDSSDYVDGDGTRWLCSTRTVERQSAPTDYATLDPNAEVIYPGALIQGASISNATPDPIDVKRAPGTISIDLINGSKNVAVTVPEMTQGAIRQAMNDIIASNNGIGAANFTYHSQEVESRDQFAAYLNVNVKTISSKFDASVKFSQSSSLHRWLVRLDQIYYTMSFDRPTSLDEVFAPEVTPSDLERYVGPGNPATYISSVTYGRIFYLLIESEASREALAASVKASYEAAVAGGSISGGAKYVKELKNTTIQVFAMGGDQSKALATFNGDYGAVRDFLTTGGDIRTGRPLSYTLRALKDNKTVYVKVNNQFDVTECQPVAVTSPNPIVWYSGDFGVETDPLLGANAVKRWKDKFGNEALDAVPTAFTYCGFSYDAPGGGSAVGFQAWQYSAKSSSGMLRLQGQGFENTDYTVFAVVRNMTEPGINKPVRFAWSANHNPGTGFELGFADDNHVLFSHGDGLTLTAPTLLPSQQDYELLTFRFSQAEGMSIYVNGSLQASDPSLTTPLSTLAGAVLGASDETGFPQASVSVYLAEFKAYGAALTDEQRSKEESALREQYGL